MGEEVALGARMEKLDDIFVANNTTTASFRKGFRWDDNPEVVGVIMGITSHLSPLLNKSVKPQADLKTIIPWLLTRPSG